MLSLVALRSLAYRPWRSALLFAGYGVGVGVMIALLSIGEALLTQARDERLVGGGDVTVLPEGLDIEVMKTGGVGGLYFSIDHSRFVYRQLLAGPRLARDVRAVAPQIDGKLVYLTTRAGRTIPVRAFGEIPERTRAVGAAPALAAGAWLDDDGDREYVAPTPRELRDELDRFHLPPNSVRDRSSWAEWDYFNVLAPDGRSWVFLSLIVGGDIPAGRWGGRVVATVHGRDGSVRRYAATVPAVDMRFSTTSADLRIGSSSVAVLPDGRYAVRAVAAREDGSAGTLTADLVVTPAPGAYFPGAALGSGGFVSGYVVPALRASATGRVCETTGARGAAARCDSYAAAQAYHDHNWGTWSGVTWDWGAARAGEYTFLYGRVIPPDSIGSAGSLFVYLVDSLGFRAVFRPRSIRYVDGREIRVDGRAVRVPSTAEFADVRGGDTLRVRLDIESAMGTDMRAGLVSRGEQAGAGALARPYFIQMKGTATIAGRVGGEPVAGRGSGFFETYR